MFSSVRSQDLVLATSYVIIIFCCVHWVVVRFGDIGGLQERVMRFYYMSQHPKKLHTTFQAAWQYRGRGKQIKSVTYAWWRRTVVLILIFFVFIEWLSGLLILVELLTTTVYHSFSINVLPPFSLIIKIN
jgi:hypothetical protein